MVGEWHVMVGEWHEMSRGVACDDLVLGFGMYMYYESALLNINYS